MPDKAVLTPKVFVVVTSFFQFENSISETILERVEAAKISS